MKNMVKLFGTIALVAVIGFITAGCDWDECNHPDGLTYWENDFIIAPTCSTTGLAKGYCWRCESYENVSVPVTQDRHNIVWTTTAQASCISNGSKEGTCSLCNKHETESINKLPHYGPSNIIKEPTCLLPGQREVDCTSCHQKQTEIISALGHSWRTVNSGIWKRQCSRCNEYSLI